MFKIPCGELSLEVDVLLFLRVVVDLIKLPSLGFTVVVCFLVSSYKSQMVLFLNRHGAIIYLLQGF